MFMPARRVEPHLFVAPTFSTVNSGKVVVPVMNIEGRVVKLPKKEALGTWIPTASDVEILEMTGELGQDRVRSWLRDLCQNKAPFSNESELALGEMDEHDKELLLQLLRNYPALLEPRSECPPMTTLGVTHEIHTGLEAPVK
ncbi:hypothetical protein PF008_g31916, partial [Phytophthora fragariae]